MWLFYALLAAFGYSGVILLIKLLTQKHKDTWSLLFFFALCGALFTLPFFIFERDIPTDWPLLIIATVIIMIYNYLQFKSYNFLGATTIAVLTKVRLIWLFLLGIFLGEIILLKNVLGILFIIVASLIIVNYNDWKASKKGVTLILLASFFFTAFAMLMKPLAENIQPFSLIFLAFVISTVITTPFISKKQITTRLKSWKLLLALGFFAAFTNVALTKALTFDQHTLIFFIFEASLIPLIVGEYFVLKDKKRVPQKIAAIIIALIGIILIG